MQRFPCASLDEVICGVPRRARGEFQFPSARAPGSMTKGTSTDVEKKFSQCENECGGTKVVWVDGQARLSTMLSDQTVGKWRGRGIK